MSVNHKVIFQIGQIDSSLSVGIAFRKTYNFDWIGNGTETLQLWDLANMMAPLDVIALKGLTHLIEIFDIWSKCQNIHPTFETPG